MNTLLSSVPPKTTRGFFTAFDNAIKHIIIALEQTIVLGECTVDASAEYNAAAHVCIQFIGDTSDQRRALRVDQHCAYAVHVESVLRDTVAQACDVIESHIHQRLSSFVSILDAEHILHFYECYRNVLGGPVFMDRRQALQQLHSYTPTHTTVGLRDAYSTVIGIMQMFCELPELFQTFPQVKPVHIDILSCRMRDMAFNFTNPHWGYLLDVMAQLMGVEADGQYVLQEICVLKQAIAGSIWEFDELPQGCNYTYDSGKLMEIKAKASMYCLRRELCHVQAIQLVTAAAYFHPYTCAAVKTWGVVVDYNHGDGISIEEYTREINKQVSILFTT